MIAAVIAKVFGLEASIGLQLAVVAICVGVFGLSVYLGLEKGIKRLSDINVLLAIAFMQILYQANPFARLAQPGVAVRWTPFLLDPNFAAQGWADSPFNLYPAKGAYMWRDLERLCAEQGLPLRRPTRFPRNGLLAARVAYLPNPPML